MGYGYTTTFNDSVFEMIPSFFISLPFRMARMAEERVEMSKRGIHEITAEEWLLCKFNVKTRLLGDGTRRRVAIAGTSIKHRRGGG